MNYQVYCVGDYTPAVPLVNVIIDENLNMNGYNILNTDDLVVSALTAQTANFGGLGSLDLDLQVNANLDLQTFTLKTNNIVFQQNDSSKLTFSNADTSFSLSRPTGGTKALTYEERSNGNVINSGRLYDTVLNPPPATTPITITAGSNILVSLVGDTYTIRNTNMRFLSITGESNIYVNNTSGNLVVGTLNAMFSNIIGGSNINIATNNGVFTINNTNSPFQSITGGSNTTITNNAGVFVINSTSSNFQNILAGSNTTIVNNSGVFTINNTSSNFQGMANGNGINVSLNAGVYTLNSSSSNFKGITAGSNITVVNNDADNFTINNTNAKLTNILGSSNIGVSVNNGVWTLTSTKSSSLLVSATTTSAYPFVSIYSGSPFVAGQYYSIMVYVFVDILTNTGYGITQANDGSNGIFISISGFSEMSIKTTLPQYSVIEGGTTEHFYSYYTATFSGIANTTNLTVNAGNLASSTSCVKPQLVYKVSLVNF